MKNIHQSPVTENQIESRSLLKAFAVAAARAQQKFGVSFQSFFLQNVINSYFVYFFFFLE